MANQKSNVAALSGIQTARMLQHHEKAALCSGCGKYRSLEICAGLNAILHNRSPALVEGMSPIYSLCTCGSYLVLLLDPQTSHAAHGWN